MVEGDKVRAGEEGGHFCCLVIHSLKGFQSFFSLRLTVAVPYKTHSDEAEKDEDSGIREENRIPQRLHQGAGQHRGDYLSYHRSRIVKTGKLSYIAAPAHLHYHRKRIDIDGRPGKAYQGKDHEHDGVDGGEAGSQEETGDKAGC